MKAGRGVFAFVIQKHDASHLHYDFRVEAGGTLKSWAVPKGIPFEKGEKRLAVEVEDHPVEYGKFEGTIPEGEYGGGTVMVWDKGTYENLGGDTLADLAGGKLHMALHGSKLEGEWTLVRTSCGGGKQWLLIKTGADLKPVSKRRDDESALTGRSMGQIAGATKSQRTSPRPASQRTSPRAKPASGKSAPKLHFIEPMRAALVSDPPAHGDWEFELKFDGYRALALKSGQTVQLLSRNGNSFGERYPEIAGAVLKLPAEVAVLDGEIVALDPQGHPSFQLLQGFATGTVRPPLAFYIFDLLREDARDLTALGLQERRDRLKTLLEGVQEPLRFSATIEGEPRRMLQEVAKMGLEGLMGKERHSSYQAGVRSRSWIKLKCVLEQEFVIGGYTPPEGSRKHFGALLVGFFEKKKLHFAGKVGTGFSDKLLASLHHQMTGLDQEKCPFTDLPVQKQGRWGQNITPREMARCHWTKARLVCQVRFSEWTVDGRLRHPVFLGLRVDKEAGEVTRERAC